MSNALAQSRMPVSRRTLLQWLGALGVAGTAVAGPTPAVSGSDAEASAFAAVSLDHVLKALGGTPTDSTQVAIKVPDYVENGYVVPVEVTSAIAGAQTIFIIAEMNPFPLIARFSVPDGTEPFISVRIKVGESCNIYAIVKSGDLMYWASKATKVTIGGCGA